MRKISIQSKKAAAWVCVTAALTLSVQSAVVVEVGGNGGLSDTPEDFLFDFTSNVTFSGGTGTATGLTVIGSTIGDFTFDLTIAPQMVGGTGELNFDGAFISEGNASATGNEFNDGDIFTITVSNIVTTSPGAPVTFLGFTNIGTADNGTDEGITINGTSYIRGTATNGDADPRFGVVFPGSGIIAGPTLTVESEGTVALRGVALEFDVVPEPSSILLLGLGGVTIAFRRRRK